MKTITVKGTGYVSASPDVIELRFGLESTHQNYGSAMELAEKNIASLTNALLSVGFEKRSLVTSSFDINTDYQSKRNSDGDCVSFFVGYRISHHLKIEFDLDTKKLEHVLAAISLCEAKPKLTVNFRVKNPSAVSEKVLRSAAQNARAKAEILASASGVSLGELVAINYDWAELNVYSRTKYLGIGVDANMPSPHAIDIEPEDIDAEDSATFIWQIA